ncbi:MAG: hypothetical protein EAY68_08725, partial [Bacteroidetes bacterium]
FTDYRLPSLINNYSMELLQTLLIILTPIAVVTIALNYIPELTKKRFPKTEKGIQIAILITALLYILFTVANMYGYKIKGRYTHTVTTYLFWLSSLAYFVLVENTKLKLLSIFLVVPIWIITFFSITFGRQVYQTKIDDDYRLIISSGGWLTCGEPIYITQTQYLFFNKEIKTVGELCLKGVYRVDVKKINEDGFELFFYSSELTSQENPIRFVLYPKKLH